MVSNSRAKSDQICVLLSGGLDSAVMLVNLARRGKNVVPLYIRCGLRWENVEISWTRRLLRSLRKGKLANRIALLEIVDMPMRSIHKAHWGINGRSVPSEKTNNTAVYLPGRNVLLISLAAIFATQRGISRIAIGILGVNPFKDATPIFLKHFSISLREALGTNVKIVRPLGRLDKAGVLKSARDVPFHLTFSCINPKRGIHCGRCNKCAERKKSFKGIGMIDPTRYTKGK